MELTKKLTKVVFKLELSLFGGQHFIEADDNTDVRYDTSFVYVQTGADKLQIIPMCNVTEIYADIVVSPDPAPVDDVVTKRKRHKHH